MKLCPECGSSDLIVRVVTSYHINSGEFYAHSVKSHDPNAEVMCLKCWCECKQFELDEN